MDAIEFIKQVRRMGEARGETIYFKSEETDTEIVERVLEWAKEHPVKTRQSEFLKMFPDTEMLESGCLNICPNLLSKEYRSEEANECNQPDFNCGKCKRDFWLKEIE